MNTPNAIGKTDGRTQLTVVAREMPAARSAKLAHTGNGAAASHAWLLFAQRCLLSGSTAGEFLFHLLAGGSSWFGAREEGRSAGGRPRRASRPDTTVPNRRAAVKCRVTRRALWRRASYSPARWIAPTPLSQLGGPSLRRRYPLVYALLLELKAAQAEAGAPRRNRQRR